MLASPSQSLCLSSDTYKLFVPMCQHYCALRIIVSQYTLIAASFMTVALHVESV